METVESVRVFARGAADKDVGRSGVVVKDRLRNRGGHAKRARLRNRMGSSSSPAPTRHCQRRPQMLDVRDRIARSAWSALRFEGHVITAADGKLNCRHCHNVVAQVVRPAAAIPGLHDLARNPSYVALINTDYSKVLQF